MTPSPLRKTLSVLVVAACSLLTGIGQQAAAPAHLKYAIIVTRHGVRSPTWTADRLNQYSAQPWPDWEVPPGNLTTHGRLLMQLMGTYYREHFIAEGLIGRTGCTDTDRTFIWADTDQRTLETARALSE